MPKDAPNKDENMTNDNNEVECHFYFHASFVSALKNEVTYFAPILGAPIIGACFTNFVHDKNRVFVGPRAWF